MTTWFTAELHLGHVNIIAYTGRPFDDVEWMNRALVDGWNKVVAQGDTVWVLGDFALGRIADTLGFAGELAGRKILLPGNHDRCWSGHRKRAAGWTDRYLDAGFDEIIQGPTDFGVDGRAVLLSHFPYRGDSHNHDRFGGHRPADRGAWLLHGHERWAQRGRMINVGVDAADFRPISEGEIARVIRAGPEDRAPSTG